MFGSTTILSKTAALYPCFTSNPHGQACGRRVIYKSRIPTFKMQNHAVL